MDWSKIDDKVKEPEQREREAREATEAQSAGIRSQVADLTARFAADLKTLQDKLAPKRHLQVGLEFGGSGRTFRVRTTKGMFGIETGQDGLSIDILNDDQRETLVFARNLGHWELAGDVRHNALGPEQYFEQQINAFVERVLK
jgi:hypothetical protein